jgi:ACR3 family arsenite efflux pump ArsB
MKLSLKTIMFPILVAVSLVLGLLLGLKVRAYSSTVTTYGIPVGLFFMIYPAMTKVRLEEIGKSVRDFKTLGLMVF